MTANMFRFILLLACAGVNFAHPQKLAATIKDFPYQVSVYSHGKYHCNGAIISDEYVLTSVHCVSFPREALEVRAGSTRLNVDGSIHKVAKIIEHDGYSSQLKRANDLALLKVFPKFEFDETRQPIPLMDGKVSVTEGDVGVVSGWGDGTNANLKAVSVNVISLLDCVDAYYSRFGDLPVGSVCTKTAVCSGTWPRADDSGAPLVVNGKLAGVFSWCYKCEDSRFPSVFMEVAYYRDWIKRHSGV